MNPVQVSYPGVYIEELPSGAKTIVGVSTSITAFVGLASYSASYSEAKLEGESYKPEPVRIFSYDEYESKFGPSHPHSDLAASVRLFFENGGSDCYVMNIADEAEAAYVAITDTGGHEIARFTARQRGARGNLSKIKIDVDDRGQISVQEIYDGKPVGTHMGCTIEEGKKDLASIENRPYRWVECKVSEPGRVPDSATFWLKKGKDTTIPETEDLFDAYEESINKLEEVDLFNLMVITKLVSNNVLISVAEEFQSIAGSAMTEAKGSLSDAETALTELKNEFGTANDAIGGSVTSIETDSSDVKDITNPMITALTECPDDDPAEMKRRLQTAYNILKTVPTSFDQIEAELKDIESKFNAADAAFEQATSQLDAAFDDFSLSREILGDVETPAVDTKNDAIDKFTALYDLYDATVRKFNEAQSPFSTSKTALESALTAIEDAKNKRITAGEICREGMEYIISFGEEDEAIGKLSAKINQSIVILNQINSLMNDILTELGKINYTSLVTLFGDGDEAATALSAASAYLTGTAEQPYLDTMDSLVTAAESRGMNDTEYKRIASKACGLCVSRRAFLLVDPLDAWTSYDLVEDDLGGFNLQKDHAAIYFPRLKIIEEGTVRTIGPAAAVAGIMARTDTKRGVWKAPAGIDANVQGSSVLGLDLILTDPQNGVLNKAGVNCIRAFESGLTCWGARTMAGDDDLASEWKYVPIRRLALFIEETLFRGTKWVVFEPNDEPTYSTIRLNITKFMLGLFDDGAFQGGRKAAFFVKCDYKTTTAYDRELGIVNILIGFAPLKPAEFVIIKIQQIVEQSAS